MQCKLQLIPLRSGIENAWLQLCGIQTKLDMYSIYTKLNPNDAINMNLIELRCT